MIAPLAPVLVQIVPLAPVPVLIAQLRLVLPLRAQLRIAVQHLVQPLVVPQSPDRKRSGQNPAVG